MAISTSNQSLRGIKHTILACLVLAKMTNRIVSRSGQGRGSLLIKQQLNIDVYHLLFSQNSIYTIKADASIN